MTHTPARPTFENYLPVSHEGRPAKLDPNGRVTVTDEFGEEKEAKPAKIDPPPVTKRWHDPYE